MLEFQVAPEVEAELDGIWLYIARRSGSTDIATRAIDGIASRFALLARNPHIGRIRNELRPGLRSFPVGDYIIFYRIESDKVIILHIVHGARNIQNLLSDWQL